jgi:hypothetical protein
MDITMQSIKHLLFEPTMDTTIEVDVDELCTKTVTNTPTIKPQIGLLMNDEAKMFPAARPACTQSNKTIQQVNICRQNTKNNLDRYSIICN